MSFPGGAQCLNSRMLCCGPARYPGDGSHGLRIAWFRPRLFSRIRSGRARPRCVCFWYRHSYPICFRDDQIATKKDHRSHPILRLIKGKSSYRNSPDLPNVIPVSKIRRIDGLNHKMRGSGLPEVCPAKISEGLRSSRAESPSRFEVIQDRLNLSAKKGRNGIFTGLIANSSNG